MAFRILPDETVEGAVRRIAQEQVSSAIHDIDDGSLDHQVTVHEVRKRCKKIRGLIRLVRPSFSRYASENACFRDAARALSDLRDATAMIECFDALVDRYRDELEQDPFGSVREALQERLNGVAASQDVERRLAEFREAMEEGYDRVGAWSLDAEGYEAVRGGLKKTYRRARKAMRKAYGAPAVERFHEWRKRVKYNRYHTRLLREIWEPIMRPRRDQVKRLSDLLGDDHDLGVFRALLVDETDRFGRQRDLQALLALIDQRRRELEAWSHPLGQRLYAEKPKRYADRMGRIWQAWRAEQDISSAFPEDSDKVFS